MRLAAAALAISLAFPATADVRLKSWVLDTPPPAGMEEKSPSDYQGLKVATVGILVGTAVALIAWDVLIAANHAPTESQLITGYAWRYSTLPFVLGILIGHWLFTHAAPWSTDLWPVMAASVGTVLVWDLCKQGDSRSWTRYPGIWFAVGVPVGALLWGQRH